MRSSTGVLGYIHGVRRSRRSRKLVGEGVELRRHDRANYSLYARWYGDEEVWRLTSWTAEPMRRAAVERLFEDRQRSSLDDSFAVHWEGEEEPVGVISLTNISQANASADLSVIVGDEKDRDRGLGTEAIRIILRYAFEDSGLNRVGLSVFDFNEPAIHAYEKLGFKTEGRLRQAIRRGESFHDAILMSILAHEWRENEI
jgi:RimJ/RimL family protein N-acetyltransferase